MSAAELDSLVELITSQVQVIKAICAAKNTSLTSIHEPDATPGLTVEPTVARATDVVIAASKRLIATLANPSGLVIGVAGGMYGSSLLNVVVEANVTEALREAGPQGLHVRELGAKVGMDPGKLGRVLRYLTAMHNIYQELSPDVFANNRLWMALDTGKAFDEVKDRGPLRYSGSEGAGAFVGTTTDEMLKGAAVLSEVLLDPETAFSVDPTKAAVMRAYGYNGGWWDWIEQEKEKKKFHRFGEAMKNTNAFFFKEEIVNLYPWDSIPKGGVIVDVGGGLGGATLPLAKAFPELRFVVQDRAPVIAEAEKFWQVSYPEAIESGSVKLQAHNFFEPQPVRGANVYILRYILHDWPDKEAVQILQQLHPALDTNSKVILIEHILPYACQTSDTGDIPAVLCGNLPPAGGMPYMLDIQMLNSLNAEERTARAWEKLARAAGFKAEFTNPGSACTIVCVPASA